MQSLKILIHFCFLSYPLIVHTLSYLGIPGNITEVDSTPSSLILSWPAVGSAADYNITWEPTDNPDALGSSNISSTNSTTILDLEPATTYDITVAACAPCAAEYLQNVGPSTSITSKTGHD